jgi:hypothetical protein
MTQTKTKLAQDLNKGDKFLHNDLGHWRVMEQPIVNSDSLTVIVKAKNSISNNNRVFNFGRLVRLDLD